MFNSVKILDEICYLLSLNNNRLNLLKLMKELYLADRLSIGERGTSISGDTFYSMPHGPVLSGALNMLYDMENNKWSDILCKIKAKYYFDVSTKKVLTEFNNLSEHEKEYLSVFQMNLRTTHH